MKLVVIEIIKRIIYITLGAALMGIALELFLVPYSIIDGGIAGIAIMSSHLTSMPLSVLLFTINIPFLIIGYHQLGRAFAFSTLYGITVMALTTHFLHHIEPFPDDRLLAVLFGGIILGAGVGVVIRYGGCLDGVEVLSILIAKKTRMSVGMIIMLFNIVIFIVAGFVFEWSSAMYSIVTYYLATKIIDLVVEGLNKSKSVTIITQKSKQISDDIVKQLGRTTTIMPARGGYSGNDTEVIYCVVSQLELPKLKAIVQRNDATAFIAIEQVSDVMGGSFSRKKTV